MEDFNSLCRWLQREVYSYSIQELFDKMNELSDDLNDTDLSHYKTKMTREVC